MHEMNWLVNYSIHLKILSLPSRISYKRRLLVTVLMQPISFACLPPVGADASNKKTRRKDRTIWYLVANSRDFAVTNDGGGRSAVE